jgi:Fe-S cluster assembly protein SufD
VVSVTETNNRYESDFHDLVITSSGLDSDWLGSLRGDAWSVFQSLGIPTPSRGNERWKYTNLTPLARSKFYLRYDPDGLDVLSGELNSHAPWHKNWATLVFVDGRYDETLSALELPNGLTVGNLGTVNSLNSEVVRQNLGHLAKVESDAFVALNTAFLDDGAFVRVDDDANIELPVHLLFITTDGQRPGVTYPRVLVTAGTNSRFTLIESYVGLGGRQRFTDAVTEIELDSGAHLRHFRMLLENEHTFHIGIIRVKQSRDSSFDSLSFSTGPAIGRNDVHTLLDGPGSVSTLQGLYMTTNRQHLDNHISTTHSKPNATSHQYYKGILAGRSRAVFSGRVLVERDAQTTYADQKDLNLCLSRGVEIDTKPSLEIYADDVKCSHGATAGHVDTNSIFYLRSRGVDLETASRMVIRGFADEIIEKIELDPLRDYVESITDRLLPLFRVEDAA